MKNQFIPYQQALALKELGFDEDCFMHYEINDISLWQSFGKEDFYKNSTLSEFEVSAPLWQQAFDWFREKHNLFGEVIIVMNDIKGESKYLTKYGYKITGTNEKASSTVFKTVENQKAVIYQKAQQACLEKLIEIVKSK